MHMRSLFILLLVSASLAAQATIAPANEIDRYAGMLGRWEGEGTFRMEAGGDPMPWTSVQHVYKIMDGKFLRDDTVIDLGPMGPLAMIGFHTFDGESKKYVSFNVSSTGEVKSVENTWIDANTLVQMSVGFENGQRKIERWTNKISKDKITMVGEVAMGDGPFFSHVSGTMTRKEGAAPKVDGVGSMMGMPAPDTMKQVLKMAGQYRVAGTYAMAPETEAEKFTGNETIDGVFGGLICRFRARSDDESYEGLGFIGWDANENRLKTLHLDSMGSAHLTDGWLVDDTTVVSCQSGTMMGSPMTMRSVLTLDAQGRPAKTIGHAMMGTSAPFVTMTATYTPVTKARD